MTPTHTAKKRKTTKETGNNVVNKSQGKTILSLAAYISNIFFGFFIQDDDDIALQVYEKNWARDVEEIDNGHHLNFIQFLDTVQGLRSQFQDRQLLSQSAVVAPADSNGMAGQVAHTSHFSAEKGGAAVTGTIVSVLKIEVVEGRRQVRTESFVFALNK